MRDHTKLNAFHCADELTLSVYQVTKRFPKDELFGLTSQIRRAAVSIGSNIVEGCARRTERDYVHFLEIAYASAREMEYQMSLAFRLGYIDEESYRPFAAKCAQVGKMLNALVNAFPKGRQ